MTVSFVNILVGLVILAVMIRLYGKAWQRLQLSLAKNPSLGGHLRWAKRIARRIPGYSYAKEQWFDIDGAPADIAQKRQHALAALGHDLTARSPLSLQQTADSKKIIADLQFVSQYRVPFQFRDVLQQHIQIGSYMQSSDGVWLTDLDGVRLIDVTGSYGVNVFGQDFYKSCIEEGSVKAQALGPVLGSYHPCVLDNIQRLCEISGKDQVSFHMSGTEAVMQAVRVARYQTGRNKIVRFTGAYHGWWDDVQPGPGNPMPPSKDTLTLREMHENTLRVLRNRKDIACVLINPLQAMHPNQAAPTDNTTVDGSRRAHYDRAAYTQWLKTLREVCTDKGIALIFDEVFMGFRLAKGGAQEYFGVQADVVTYGKTLAGGLPVGVVCGTDKWMTRFRSDRPGDICFARGTFNAHPYVMGAMNVFLHRLDTEEIMQTYRVLDETWLARKAKLNERFKQVGLPLRVEGVSTVWTVLFDVPSRYNWMLQFYMRREGIALSWVGTGRMIFSLNFSDADFDMLVERFVLAGQKMSADGWWWTPVGQTNKQIKRQILKEMLQTVPALQKN
jgi:glutamate-1-semialdehyde 2,1-aminomutase